QASARAQPPMPQMQQSHSPPPPAYSAPPSSPSYSAPIASGYPLAPSPVDTPSENVPRPVAAGIPGSNSVSLPIGLATPLQSPKNRLIVLSTMGALCLISLVVIIAKTALAKPPVVASEAEQSYRAGLKLFLAKDYEGAKINFNDALQMAPDS